MLQVGIIGYGQMGKIRYNHLLGNPGSVVRSVFHTEPVDGPFQFASDWKTVVRDPDIDVIFICVPNCLTCEIAVEGLENGKHVFAEKPPGISVAEVREMIAAEKRNPTRKLMFGFNHRHHASVRLAKSKIDSGEFGEILWMRGRYGKSVDERFYNNWRSRKASAGGGILMDQGIHMLDLLMMFAGGFTEVKSHCSNRYWDLDIEDNVFAILNNDRGVVASLHSTMTQWRHLFALEIFLERGYVVLNGLLTSSGTYTSEDGKEVLTIAKQRSSPPAAVHQSEERYTFSVDESWQFEINQFLDIIEKDTQPEMCHTQDALALMTLVEKIYADGKNGGKEQPDHLSNTSIPGVEQ